MFFLAPWFQGFVFAFSLLVFVLDMQALQRVVSHLFYTFFFAVRTLLCGLPSSLTEFSAESPSPS